MGAVDSAKNIIHGMPAFAWFVLVAVLMFGFILHESHQLTERNKFILFMVAAFGLILAYRNRERPLIGITKAMNLARDESEILQRAGELPGGATLRHCEASLIRIDRVPQHYIAATYVEARVPFFQVYWIHPYEAPRHLAIEKMKKVREFDVDQIPDYRIIVPTDLLSFIQQKKALEGQYGTSLG